MPELSIVIPWIGQSTGACVLAIYGIGLTDSKEVTLVLFSREDRGARETEIDLGRLSTVHAK